MSLFSCPSVYMKQCCYNSSERKPDTSLDPASDCHAYCNRQSVLLLDTTKMLLSPRLYVLNRSDNNAKQDALSPSMFSNSVSVKPNSAQSKRPLTFINI